MPHQDDAKLPIFWIGGRSGTGKSIALLYVLSQLFERGYDGILWVGHGDEIRNLPAAVSYALELRQTCDRQVIIGIDDPHIPASQNEASQYWQQAIDLLQQPMQEFEPENIPIVICCGPTEQKELFERDNIRPDQIELYGELIPQASGEDYKLLCDYYRSRIGKEPPNTGDSNMLLTQLFFEWKSGFRLTQFAERFKQRVQSSDPSSQKGLYSLLSEILSLNRLYTAYPAEIAERRLNKMSAVAMLAFENLLEENHLQLLNETDGRRGSGYFMQHPHIANAIYEVWHPEKPAQERQKHLNAAIEDIFRHSNSSNEEVRLAPVWALSNALEPNSPTASRLDSAIVRNLVEPLFRLYRDERPVAVNSLAVWVDLHLRCRALDPDKKLHANPIPLAIDKIRNSTASTDGLINLCYKVLQLFDLLDKLEQTAVIKSLLTQLKSNPGWEDWPRIWDRLRKLTSIRPVYKAENEEEIKLVKDIVETGFLWVEDINNCNNYYWQQVWAGLPKVNRKRRMTARFSKLTEVWLNRTPAHHSWRSIWSSCRKINQDNKYAPQIEKKLSTAGIGWLTHMLRHNPHHASWHYIWGAIFQDCADKQPLVELLERYLQCIDDKKSSNNSFGWSMNRLIQHYESYPLEEYKLKVSILQPKIIEWLTLYPNEPYLWPHLWSAAHQTEPDNEQTVSMGKVWLFNVTSDYRAIRRVWTPLFQTSTSDVAEMIDIGKRLLTEFSKFHDDKPRSSWPIVWSDLWDAVEVSDKQQATLRLELIMYGKEWLEAAAAIEAEKIAAWNEEEVASWQTIWTRLEKACPMQDIAHLQRRWASATT